MRHLIAPLRGEGLLAREDELIYVLVESEDREAFVFGDVEVELARRDRLLQEERLQRPYLHRFRSSASNCGSEYSASVRSSEGSLEPVLGRGVPKSLERRADGSNEGEQFLVHLMGARFVLALWIMADHFIHEGSIVFNRANVAVDGFIILSGFITQWAYGERDFRGWGAYVQFYVRRIGRVVATTYVSMALAIMLLVATSGAPKFWYTARCLTFIEPWIDPENWCPNGQTWTIAALLPSWILYPWTKRVVAAVEAAWNGFGLVMLCIALWSAALLPSLTLFFWQDGNLTVRQHNYAYVWPPSQLPDFLLGVTAAALARRHAGSRSMFQGILSDASAALILLLVVVIPRSDYHSGWEPLFNHCLAPLWALFLYESSACSRVSLVALLLRQFPLPQCGSYSFEVFLFQQPIYEVFEVLWLAGLNEFLPFWILVISYLLVLFTSCCLYAELVEVPFARWLREVTTGWA